MDGFSGFKITVYSKSRKSRYVSFCTPEARQMLELYFRERQSEGETITPDSPVFRLEFHNVKHMDEYAIRQAVNSCARSTGLRPKMVNNKRHQVASMHGFRKFAYSAFVKAGVRDAYVKRLAGHSGGLQKNYLIPEDTDLLQDYIKSIPLLTIYLRRGI